MTRSVNDFVESLFTIKDRNDSDCFASVISVLRLHSLLLKRHTSDNSLELGKTELLDNRYNSHGCHYNTRGKE